MDWSGGIPTLGLKNVQEGQNWINLDGNRRYAALYLLKPTECPACGQTEKFYQHGKVTQTFHDLPISGQRIVIRLERVRYRCPACGKAWLLPLDPASFHEKRHVTARVFEHVKRFVWDSTFSDLAFEMGIDHQLVRRLFLDYAEELEMKYHAVTPRALGIDEVHLAKKARGVLIDLDTGKPYDLLESATRLAFSRRFFRMKDREKVEIVTMDQTAYFRRLAREFFPNATVIADKWHILTHVDKALQAVRIAYRDKLPKPQRAGLFGDRWVLQKRHANLSGEEKLVLETWTTNHPTIGLAYALKEDFYNLYDLKDRAEAERRYAVWKKLVTDDVAPFRIVAKSVDRWHDQVFNYFDHGRYTNAKTEQVNGRIKEIQRDGRGYGFDILRAKVLFKSDSTVRRRVDAKGGDWVEVSVG